MPETIRQQIMTKVGERLAAIATPDYNNDFANRVSAWPVAPWEVSQLPRVGYRDIRQDSKPLNVSNNRQEHRLTVEIIAEFAAGNTSPESARKAEADIFKAIGVDTRWSALAFGTEPGTSDMLVSKEEKQIAGVKMTIVIIYRTNAWDAYNQ